MFHVKHRNANSRDHRLDMTPVDVIVVGGGHAGAEAAHAAWRMGARTIMVTHRFDRIGEMSCNPAIGGLGKGHLVREIDALDGVMGRVADKAGIQFRLLNRSKGPAVQGPRVQADRALYRSAMQPEFRNRPGMSVVEGEVTDFCMAGPGVAGVVLADGTEIRARSVVLTTGTFLRGVIHIGNESRPGGRIGDKPASRLAKRMESFGFSLGRLKTGTPPRLDGTTIDWSRAGNQPGDQDPVMFSFLSAGPTARQVPCGVTETNAGTHEIIRENLEKSAMYGARSTVLAPGTARRSRTRSFVFLNDHPTRSFLSPKASRMIPFIPTAFRHRCRLMSSLRMSGPFAAWKRPSSGSRATRSNTTTLIRGPSPDTRGEGSSRPVFGRADQRNNRIRGSGGARSGRRVECGCGVQGS